MRSSIFAAAIAATAALGSGCAGPGPALFPLAPITNQTVDGVTVELGFDSAGDGTVDYTERLDAAGRVVGLRIDADRDGSFEIDRPWGPGPVGDAEARHLVILLDSIPYEMVREAWEHGRFRLFHPPTRTICPFPVLTDLSFAELYGASPCPGCESEYFDGKKLVGGTWTYAAEGNSPWVPFTDYHLTHVIHVPAYLWPRTWLRHEMGKIQRGFVGADAKLYTGYVLSTSAIGHQFGRDGHLEALVLLDRFCRWVVHHTRGNVHITLLSDHGHNLMPGRFLDVREVLASCGYSVGDRLDGPADVVVPQWGVVTSAAVHTKSPAAVARDLISADGIELTAYCEPGGDLVVLGRNGRARITRSEAGFRYVAERGDPLELKPILTALTAGGRVDADGFVADRVLFEATGTHKYPDGVYRLWRAFHGLVKNTPDVLVSLEDGRYFGSRTIDWLVECKAAHGNLNLPGSSGFVMTTASRLPAVMRMEDLHGALKGAGVPLRPKPLGP